MRAAVLLLALCHARAADGPFMPRRSTQPPHCPQGFRVVETGGPLKFRCVAERAGSVDRVLASPEPAEAREAPAAAGPSDYQTFLSANLKADVPRGWARTDAWNDEVPTLFLELGERRKGKPVSMTVSRFSPEQREYEPLDAALAKEREYQGSRETRGRKVGGLQARHTVVPGENRSAYVDAGAGVYYVLTYSAPNELFKAWEPAFDRLLSSARFK
jgi:hypothetical protein